MSSRYHASSVFVLIASMVLVSSSTRAATCLFVAGSPTLRFSLADKSGSGSMLNGSTMVQLFGRQGNMVKIRVSNDAYVWRCAELATATNTQIGWIEAAEATTYREPPPEAIGPAASQNYRDARLFLATRMKDLAMVEHYLALGANPMRCLDDDVTRLRPLVEAPLFDEAKLANYLLSSLAEKSNALLAASSQAQPEIARRLLAGTPALNRVCHPGDPSPLVAAIQNGDITITQLLLDRGANPNYYETNDMGQGLAPITAAIRQGSPQLLTILLHHGVRADRRPGRGKDENDLPMLEAASVCNATAVEALAAAGARADRKSANGTPPLLAALDYCQGRPETKSRTLEALLAAGAKVDAEYQSRTPLQSAAYQGNRDAARLLTRAGANPTRAWCTLGQVYSKTDMARDILKELGAGRCSCPR